MVPFPKRQADPRAERDLPSSRWTLRDRSRLFPRIPSPPQQSQLIVFLVGAAPALGVPHAATHGCFPNLPPSLNPTDRSKCPRCFGLLMSFTAASWASGGKLMWFSSSTCCRSHTESFVVQGRSERLSSTRWLAWELELALSCQGVCNQGGKEGGG